LNCGVAYSRPLRARQPYTCEGAWLLRGFFVAWVFWKLKNRPGLLPLPTAYKALKPGFSFIMFNCA